MVDYTNLIQHPFLFYSTVFLSTFHYYIYLFAYPSVTISSFKSPSLIVPFIKLRGL